MFSLEMPKFGSAFWLKTVSSPASSSQPNNPTTQLRPPQNFSSFVTSDIEWSNEFMGMAWCLPELCNLNNLIKFSEKLKKIISKKYLYSMKILRFIFGLLIQK